MSGTGWARKKDQVSLVEPESESESELYLPKDWYENYR